MTDFVLKGGKEFQRRLVAIGKAPEGMLRETGIRGVAEAKRLVPRKTGNLGRTIRLGSMNSRYVEIRAGGTKDVGYAAAVEFGAKPHVILPRNRKALAWGGARTLGGRVRAGSSPTNFAKRVNHPGTRPKPYLIPGLQKALQIMGLDKLVDAWNRAA